eukprot:CAMPEP_0204186992 /NCGR_PEP_ID=MMETSP0361-20130328/56447_1 /ASSEMBLY_ACC=CAM_ASM_000343 /TAXON_ID=268821 /ORGANISM="Scrippsiella Hangoei, Strain SHTV-5" /LENGTH=38 /DNA_ID= /DNA_START= /DNA_END= /DNA_ORIENTATION=
MSPSGNRERRSNRLKPMSPDSGDMEHVGVAMYLNGDLT